jgi:hypothetical protein
MLRQITATALLFVATCSASADTVIAQWNFNAPPTGDNNTTTGTLVASTGSSSNTLARIGSTQNASPQYTNANVNVNVNTASSDPTLSDDSAWAIFNFANQGTGNKTRGIQVNVNTTGMENIVVTWDQRNQSGAPNTAILQYRLDTLSAWVDVQSYVSDSLSWSNGRTYSFSAISGLNNSSTAAFRIVAAFAGTSSQYVGTGATYNTFSAWNFDMITVSGTAIPPVTVVPLPPAALAGAALMACLPIAKALRRRV